MLDSGLKKLGCEPGHRLLQGGLGVWLLMNLRAENGLIRIAAVGPAIWLLLLLLLSAADYGTRGLL